MTSSWLRAQHERPQTGLPHTKLSGGTEKMLWPCSASGWAQVAVTEACSARPSSHGGNHRSWQSHRKLSLLMRLQETQRNARCNGDLWPGQLAQLGDGTVPTLSLCSHRPSTWRC